MTCGGSLQLRSRIVEKQAENGGSCAGSHVESQQCATTLCPGGNTSTKYSFLIKGLNFDLFFLSDSKKFLCKFILLIGVMSWSQTIPQGNKSSTSTYCTSMEIFQDYLVGVQTTSIVLVAGSVSYSCTNATMANKITDAFAICKSRCTTQSFLCDSHTWNVGKCGSGGEISVGDNGICKCTGQLSIRPCGDNGKLGGAGPETCTQKEQKLSITVNYN